MLSVSQSVFRFGKSVAVSQPGDFWVTVADFLNYVGLQTQLQIPTDLLLE